MDNDHVNEAFDIDSICPKKVIETISFSCCGCKIQATALDANLLQDLRAEVEEVNMAAKWRTAKLNELQAKVAELEGELDKHRWVPVSERLPKHGCSILARGKDGYGYKICAVVSYNLEFNKFRVLTDVTHWKQIYLPKAKEGKS